LLLLRDCKKEGDEGMAKKILLQLWTLCQGDFSLTT
jgi:hypothetical protein